jgi:hypothetical protein
MPVQTIKLPQTKSATRETAAGYCTPCVGVHAAFVLPMKLAAGKLLISASARHRALLAAATSAPQQGSTARSKFYISI